MYTNEESIFKMRNILAIAPCYDGKNKSIIYTPQKIFYSTKTVQQNIDHYCILNGSSVAGRIEASQMHFNNIKKPSILISEIPAIVAFQVPSSNGLEMIWIMDVEDVTIQSLEDSQSKIILSNNEKLTSSLSANLAEKRRDDAIRIFYNQHLRKLSSLTTSLIP